MPPLSLLTVFIILTLLSSCACQTTLPSVLNVTTNLYTFASSTCTGQPSNEVQIFPPWTSGVTKCTQWTGNGLVFYQAELATLDPTSCQANLTYAVWEASQGYSTCGSLSNTTGAAETLTVNINTPSSGCNYATVTPAVASGYISTNLLPYFNNVPSTCPAAVGPAYGEVEALVYNSSSCATATTATELFPPWTPGVQKCSTWYGQNATTGNVITLHQAELLTYASTTSGCGATLYWSVWNGASYPTCGSAVNASGAIETGVVQVAQLSSSSQCSAVTGTPVLENGWLSFNLDAYITGYSASTACAGTTLGPSSSSSGSVPAAVSSISSSSVGSTGGGGGSGGGGSVNSAHYVTPNLPGVLVTLLGLIVLIGMQ